jgi:phage antirepressor YoqD-like protein
VCPQFDIKICRDSINVVVISPDGKRHKQLLSSEDGLVEPQVLHYDRSTNRLLVVSISDTALLFDVTRLQLIHIKT